MMYLERGLFALRELGVLLVSQTCASNSFSRFGNFSAITSLNKFSFPLFWYTHFSYYLIVLTEFLLLDLTLSFSTCIISRFLFSDSPEEQFSLPYHLLYSQCFLMRSSSQLLSALIPEFVWFSFTVSVCLLKCSFCSLIFKILLNFLVAYCVSS